MNIYEYNYQSTVNVEACQIPGAQNPIYFKAGIPIKYIPGVVRTGTLVDICLACGEFYSRGEDDTPRLCTIVSYLRAYRSHTLYAGPYEWFNVNF